MKFEKRLVLLLTFSALLLAMSFISMTSTVRAQSSLPQVIIQPSYIFYSNYTAAPTDLQFNLTVANVTNMGTWQVTVEYNESVLSFENITLPSDNVLHDKSPIPAGPDLTTPGQFTYGVSAGPGQSGFTGSGTLAQFSLTVDLTTAPAVTLIDFQGTPINTDNTFLLDTNLANLNFTAVTSMYSFTAASGTQVTHTLPGTSNLAVTQSNGTISPNSAVVNTTSHTIFFNVTGTPGDTAFLYAEIPKDVINVNSLSEWKLYVNGVLQPQSSLQITENSTYTKVLALQFTIVAETGSSSTIGIQGTIPELSTVLAMLTIASASMVAIIKSRARKK